MNQEPQGKNTKRFRTRWHQQNAAPPDWRLTLTPPPQRPPEIIVGVHRLRVPGNKAPRSCRHQRTRQANMRILTMMMIRCVLTALTTAKARLARIAQRRRRARRGAIARPATLTARRTTKRKSRIRRPMAARKRNNFQEENESQRQ